MSENPILEQMRLAASSEGDAVAFLEARRWGDSPCCPRCGDVDVYQMRDAKTGERNKDFRWRCRGCAKAKRPAMFTVRTGTVFEESRLPLWIWVHAFWRACASKKGVSAKQIQRETGTTYKTALFVMHRIRHGMGGSDPGPLSGTLEADETFVGGRPRHRVPGHQGQHDKAPVLGLVQRGGSLRLRAVDRVTAETVDEFLARHADVRSRLMTDEGGVYKPLGGAFLCGHETIHHRSLEYARGDVTTNTIEGAFSLLKRGMYGTFHSVSKHHLPLYLNEFEFRYNTRKTDDATRTELAIRASQGKRLTYKGA